MKKILLIALVLLSIFLIYLTTIDKKVYFLALGDELAIGYNKYNKKDYGYNDYIKDYLEKKGVLEIYVDSFIDKGNRTIDLIKMIEDNEKRDINGKEKSIKNALIKADLITLSIGLNDIMPILSFSENYTDKQIYNFLDEYLDDLDDVLEVIKEYCKEDVILIGNYNLSKKEDNAEYIEYLNDKTKLLAKEFEIEYIEMNKDFESKKSKYLNKTNYYPSKEGYNYIGTKIIEVLEEKLF